MRRKGLTYADSGVNIKQVDLAHHLIGRLIKRTHKNTNKGRVLSGFGCCLEAAWGGVVNQSGKTPKTWAWLRRALEEGEPQPEASAANRVPTIDMNTPEGQAAVDLLIVRGLLPADTLTNVVRYAQ